MTIEVRQMLIKSTVGSDVPPSAQATVPGDVRDIEQWKQDILVECKAWFEEKLNELRER